MCQIKILWCPQSKTIPSLISQYLYKIDISPSPTLVPSHPNTNTYCTYISRKNSPWSHVPQQPLKQPNINNNIKTTTRSLATQPTPGKEWDSVGSYLTWFPRCSLVKGEANTEKHLNGDSNKKRLHIALQGTIKSFFSLCFLNTFHWRKIISGWGGG